MAISHGACRFEGTVRDHERLGRSWCCSGGQGQARQHFIVLAAIEGKREVVKVLAARGADLDVKDNFDGKTPMALAACTALAIP
jgi:hypothetical protein